ncbi:3-deoxy-8-phosphooctulonate synthase [Limisalsivibrio acetivorans]|uniref:3-deoxy-8-phosphooctulonate synthase n=1 Tax=Limisalsivibrio acetivorans TaxID=1304888 RepID=UPI0003B61C0A|nr:3-deoxy-8-phosphooctulonate synthase [Limisalsivibrio acetivorans]
MNELYRKLTQAPFVIAGPCVLEDADTAMRICADMKEACEKAGFSYVFKASFDKANRTSLSSYRGPGMEEGLRMLEEIGRVQGVPLLTDIHEPSQAGPAGEVADILQIPAFLCRQTDLLTSAAKTDRIINIKKAQFLSGGDMVHPLTKVRESGNHKVMLTERGTMFGYNNLVVDYRNVIDMMEMDVPVIMDATHSVQRPGGLGGKSGGDGRLAPRMAYAAAAVGVKAFFIETHPDPDSAKSDGPNMIPLGDMPDFLKKLMQFIAVTK